MKLLRSLTASSAILATVLTAQAADNFQFHFPVGGFAHKAELEQQAEEKRLAKEEAERAAQVAADKAMCLDEKTWTETETRYRTAYRTEEQWSWTYYPFSGEIGNYSGFVTSGGCTSHDTTYVFVPGHGGTQMHDTKAYDGLTLYNRYRAKNCNSCGQCGVEYGEKETVTVPYQQPYTVSETKESSQYGWCQAQGYPTAN